MCPARNSLYQGLGALYRGPAVGALSRSASGPAALSMSGSALSRSLSIGPLDGLSLGPALFIPSSTLSVAPLPALTRSPAQSVPGPQRSLCRGPALVLGIWVGAPALALLGVGALWDGLCVPPKLGPPTCPSVSVPRHLIEFAEV